MIAFSAGLVLSNVIDIHDKKTPKILDSRISLSRCYSSKIKNTSSTSKKIPVEQTVLGICMINILQGLSAPKANE